MYSGPLSPDSVRALTAVPAVALQEVEAISNPHQYGEERFANVFTKLNVFALEEFERVTFLDADTLALQSMDDIFDVPGELAAAPDHGVALRRAEFNSGVFVCRPNRAVLTDMLSRIRRTPSRDGGDQGFLNEYFRSWKRLPSSYNTLKRIYWHHPDLFDLSQIKLLHFVGDKPWDSPPGDYERFAELYELWWSAYPQELLPLERVIPESSRFSSGVVRLLRPLRKQVAPILRRLDFDGDRAYG